MPGFNNQELLAQLFTGYTLVPWDKLNLCATLVAGSHEGTVYRRQPRRRRTLLRDELRNDENTTLRARLLAGGEFGINM